MDIYEPNYSDIIDALEKNKRNSYVKVRRIENEIAHTQKRIISNTTSDIDRDRYRNRLEFLYQRLENAKLLDNQNNKELETARRIAFERDKTETVYKTAISQMIHEDLAGLPSDVPETNNEKKILYNDIPNHKYIYYNFLLNDEYFSITKNKKMKIQQKTDFIDKTIHKYFAILPNNRLKDSFEYLLSNNSSNQSAQKWADIKARETFGKNFRFYMHKQGLTIADLVKATDISYTTLKEWEKGGSIPRPSKLQLLADFFDISISDLTDERPTNRVPVLGKIPAGIPIEAIENVLDYEDVPLNWLKGNKTFFALKISGDSMYPQYLDGDVVIFEKANDCENGQHCAVMVNGDDATFKKVLKNEAGITLMPLNEEKYEPIFYSNKQIKELPITVIGVAKEIRRKLF